MGSYALGRLLHGGGLRFGGCYPGLPAELSEICTAACLDCEYWKWTGRVKEPDQNRLIFDRLVQSGLTARPMNLEVATSFMCKFRDTDLNYLLGEPVPPMHAWWEDQESCRDDQVDHLGC